MKASYGRGRIRLLDPGREAHDGHLVAERGAARRLVDDAWKGIWFRGLRSLRYQAAKSSDYEAHIHRVGVFGGSQYERSCRVLQQLGVTIEQSYSRYIRKATAHSVRLIPAAFVQCGSGIIRPHHAHRGRTATLSGSSDRSVANLDHLIVFGGGAPAPHPQDLRFVLQLLLTIRSGPL